MDAPESAGHAARATAQRVASAVIAPRAVTIAAHPRYVSLRAFITDHASSPLIQTCFSSLLRRVARSVH
eukprot:2901774-Pleurochrysis_carterae.AAC.1